MKTTLLSVLLAVPYAFVLAVQRTTNIDLDVSSTLTAITALLVVLLGWYSQRQAAKQSAKLEQVHVLVNSDRSALMAKLLTMMKSQRFMMVGLKLSELDKSQVELLDRQIIDLEAEIKARDVAAAGTKAVQK